MSTQLTESEVTKLRTIITACDNGKKISDLEQITLLNGSEMFEVVQDGVSKRASPEMIMASAPSQNGTYPDVPLNISIPLWFD